MEIPAYPDKDEYISDVSLSSVWGDADDAEIPPGRIEELDALWETVTGGVRAIAEKHGLSFRALAERFCIPYRTMENWSSGIAKPAPYLLLMMEEILSIENA